MNSYHVGYANYFSKTKIEAPNVTPRPDAKYSDKDKISFLLKQLCKTITQEKIGN